jgi:hypothetical protein
LGHPEEIGGTAAFHALDRVGGAALVDAQATIDPSEKRIAAAYLEQGSDEGFRCRMIFLFRAGSFHRVWMRRLVFAWQMDRSFVCENVDVYSFPQRR